MHHMTGVRIDLGLKFRNVGRSARLPERVQAHYQAVRDWRPGMPLQFADEPAFEIEKVHDLFGIQAALEDYRARYNIAPQ